MPPACNGVTIRDLLLNAVVMRWQIIKVPLFRGLSEQITEKLCFSIKPYLAMRLDTIYKVRARPVLSALYSRTVLPTWSAATCARTDVTRGNLKSGICFVSAQEKEVGREMFIVNQGQVTLTKQDYEIATKGVNSSFGEDAMLNDGLRRDHNAVADSDSELGFITRTDIVEIGKQYPALLEKLTAVREQTDTARSHFA